MKRIAWMVFLSLSALFAKAELTNHSPLSISRHKHVVLIVADDLGWSDVGYASSKQAITPNLDKLVKESVILNQSYAYSLCTPSRSSILTGMFAEHTGLQHYVILPQNPFGLPLSFNILPEYLKSFGYKTHMIGKWHLGSCNMSYTPASRGFDTFYGYFSGAKNYYTHSVTFMNMSGMDFWNQTKDYLKPILDKNGTYSTYTYAERAVKLIEEHDKAKPLFMYFASQNVHAMYNLFVPKKYEDMYMNITNNTNRRKLLGMATIMDEAIGNLTDALIKKGIYNDTLIIFTSDNGAEIISHGRNYPLRGGKSSAFEGGHRVRAFIRDPRIKPYSYNGMFHAVDWVPTILSAALNKPTLSGMRGLRKLDGVNQYNAIRTNGPSQRDQFIYNIDPLGNEKCNGPTEAVRKGNFKLIRGCPGGSNDWYGLTDYDRRYINLSIQDPGVRLNESCDCQDGLGRINKTNTYYLYNIKNDPEERNNLAFECLGKVRELENVLNEYKKTVVPVMSYDPFGANIDPSSNPIYFGNKWSPGWCNKS